MLYEVITSPHIQNVAVGGVSNSISHDAPSVLNIERLMLIKGFIDKLERNNFV